MLSEEDKKLFIDAVNTQTAPDKDVKNNANSCNKQGVFSDYDYVVSARLSANDVVSYTINGVNAKIIKKIKQGKITNAPMIDLHGQTTKQACDELSRFIYNNQQQRYIHIIHGKGYNSDNDFSVLKSQVVHYLKQHPGVIAFCSCAPKDGGTGAVFAVLKH